MGVMDAQTAPAADDADAGKARRVHFGIAVMFFAIGLIRLWLPPQLIFDEIHYATAAQKLTQGIVANREHPMLAKELLAVGVLVLGEQILALRIVALIAGTAGLFFASRAMWWYARDVRVAIYFPILLATSFLLFGLSRLAVLEPFAFCFTALTFLLMARGNWTGAGIVWGLAIACKWTALPLLLAALAIMLARRGLKTAFLSGALAGCVYLITFLPLLFAHKAALTPVDLPALHLAMQHTLSVFIGSHPYQSHWWQWLYGGGHFYVAYGEYGGALRSVLLATNPATAALATVAVVLAKDRAIAVFFVASLILFPLADKPVLVIHQYLLCYCLSLAALAIWLGRLPKAVGAAVSALSCVSFLAFLPSLTSGTTDVTWIYPTHAPQRVLSPNAAEIRRQANACLDAPRKCY